MTCAQKVRQLIIGQLQAIGSDSKNTVPEPITVRAALSKTPCIVYAADCYGYPDGSVLRLYVQTRGYRSKNTHAWHWSATAYTL